MDEDEVCPTCGGDRVISSDTTDSSFEHTTVESPCPDCGVTDDNDYYDEEDDERYDEALADRYGYPP